MRRYVFDEDEACFKKVTGLGLDHAGSYVLHYNDDATRKQTQITGSTFHDVYIAGVDVQTRRRRLALYGRNVVDVELTPVAKLLVREILHPFYIFQVRHPVQVAFLLLFFRLHSKRTVLKCK